MKILLNIIKFIIAIILTICVIALIIVNVASSTILNKEFILAKLDETNYYANINTAVKSDFENYIYQSGLDENVLENIVSPEKVENDTKIIINNIYDGTNEEVDVTEIETNLRNNIENSLDHKLSATQQKTVDEFIKKITEQYKDTITKTSYENSINNMLEKARNIVDKLQKVSIIGIAVAFIIIIILSIKDFMTGLMLIGSALMSSGVFYILVNMIINAKVKIQNITILNDAISISLREIISTILKNLTTIGITLSIVGFVIIIIFAIIRSSKKEERENVEQ